jgi:glycosyltransferase involved in cell wall biosynthesis
VRIGWINDHSNLVGGGEITSKYIIKMFENHNHDIVMINHKTFNEQSENIIDCDLYFLNNFRLMNPEKIKIFLDGKKYIYSNRDIVDMSYKHESAVKDIYNKSIKNIFLSPMHENKFIDKYKVNKRDNFLYIPYFEIDKYESRDKEDKICWVNSFYYHKGIENCLTWARDNKTKIDFFGSGEPLLMAKVLHSKYGKLNNKLRSDELVNILSRYRFFLHLPDEIETFSRITAEASLCGCDLLIDKNKIGFCSWEFKDRDDFIYNMMDKQNKMLELLN